MLEDLYSYISVVILRAFPSDCRGNKWTGGISREI